MKIFVAVLACYWVGVYIGWTARGLFDSRNALHEELKKINNELKQLRKI